MLTCVGENMPLFTITITITIIGDNRICVNRTDGRSTSSNGNTTHHHNSIIHPHQLKQQSSYSHQQECFSPRRIPNDLTSNQTYTMRTSYFLEKMAQCRSRWYYVGTHCSVSGANVKKERIVCAGIRRGETQGALLFSFLLESVRLVTHKPTVILGTAGHGQRVHAAHRTVRSCSRDKIV